MHPNVLTHILNLTDASGVRTGTWARLCEALSTQDHQVGLLDIIEHIPDAPHGPTDGEAA